MKTYYSKEEKAAIRKKSDESYLRYRDSGLLEKHFEAKELKEIIQDMDENSMHRGNEL